jgi:hypothetical protein
MAAALAAAATPAEPAPVATAPVLAADRAPTSTSHLPILMSDPGTMAVSSFLSARATRSLDSSSKSVARVPSSASRPSNEPFFFFDGSR